jgi:hypothetical protein
MKISLLLRKNPTPRLWCFVMNKNDVSVCTEIFQVFTAKSLLKLAVQKKLPTFVGSKHGNFVWFSVFYMYITIILKFVMSSSITKFHYNEYNFITHMI